MNRHWQEVIYKKKMLDDKKIGMATEVQDQELNT